MIKDTFSFDAMEILVIGDEAAMNQCRQKFGSQHTYQLAEAPTDAQVLLKPGTIVFDFLINRADETDMYNDFDGFSFIEVSKISLRNIHSTKTKTTLFGFIGLPTFLSREILEVSVCQNTDKKKLEEVCTGLDTRFAVVKDQVGLVTPRVVCMIINEAYFAIQENIASREDIDLAMKLGTNYPFGPFEWSERIGIKKVCGLLEAVYESTKDERYKVCDLLEREAARL